MKDAAYLGQGSTETGTYILESDMTKLRIYGSAERATLPFDLRDFLKLSAPRSITASWQVSAVDAGDKKFDATGPGGERLEAMAQSGRRISGRELSAAARDTKQVIWGMFAGSLRDAPDRNWLTIRAIDSTFYEIITDDESVLKKISASFENIHVYQSLWTPFPRETDDADWLAPLTLAAPEAPQPK